jgi:hypothetical protein
VADDEPMNSLPTSDDLLERKALERQQSELPRQRAEAIERDILAAREQCWELLAEFVERARELGIAPRVWRAPTGGSTPRITMIEGYPLPSGTVVSAPPMRYGLAERRGVRRPREQLVELEELSVFILRAASDAARAPELRELHSRTHGSWPGIARLEHAAGVLRALQRELEASLLALID